MTHQPTIHRYAVQQNTLYAPGDLPPGWDASMVSVSGGLVGWSDAHEVDEALGMTPYRVAQIIAKRLPRYGPGTRVVLDLEHPVNPGQLVHDDLGFLERVAAAWSLRAELAREHLGEDVKLYAWLSRRSFQNEPTEHDYKRTGCMLAMARMGAFEFFDGLAPGVYPICAGGQPQWARGRQVMRNTLRATRAIAEQAQHEHGRHYDVLPISSLESFGGGASGLSTADRTLAAESVRELGDWARENQAPAIAHWHAQRVLRDGADAVSLMRSVSIQEGWDGGRDELVASEIAAADLEADVDHGSPPA